MYGPPAPRATVWIQASFELSWPPHEHRRHVGNRALLDPIYFIIGLHSVVTSSEAVYDSAYRDMATAYIPPNATKSSFLSPIINFCLR